MGLRILFFGGCAERLGRKSLDVPLGAPVRVSELVSTLTELRPLRGGLGGVQIAINLEYAGADAEVRDGDEVAFLPPYSGG